MKNLQLTKLGFLLFLVLLCGCSDNFVIDTPAEAGNSYESDVHVLNKFVDISELGQKYYINPNKKSTVLSYITNSDLEELNAVNSLSASRYEKSLFRLNEKISQAISSHTVDYVVMCTSSQIFVDRINDDSPIELKSAGFTTLSDNTGYFIRGNVFKRNLFGESGADGTRTESVSVCEGSLDIPHTM